MTFAEIAKPSSYRALPLIPKDRLKLLWFDDYYDGPKSGLLLFNGEKCWYETINDSMDGPEAIPYVDFRHAVVIRPLPAQLVELEKWQELFRQKVGCHCDLDGVDRGPKFRPQETHAEFFEPYSRRVPPDFSNNEVLGWFEL